MADWRSLQYARESLFRAALGGRATSLPAGARDNQSALALIDGEIVGQLSVLGCYVREDAAGNQFVERKLLPEHPQNLPEHLRTLAEAEARR